MPFIIIYSICINIVMAVMTITIKITIFLISDFFIFSRVELKIGAQASIQGNPHCCYKGNIMYKWLNVSLNFVYLLKCQKTETP